MVTVKVKMYDKAKNKFVWYRQLKDANGEIYLIKESAYKYQLKKQKARA